MWTEEEVGELIEMTEDTMFEMIDEVLKATKKIYTEIVIACCIVTFSLGMIIGLIIDSIF